jgi:hypothetical protein
MARGEKKSKEAKKPKQEGKLKKPSEYASRQSSTTAMPLKIRNK